MTLTKPHYRPRLIDEKIKKYLKAFGAICIEGPKWCGKTWTSLHHAHSVIYMGNPENNFQNRTMAQLSPDLVLEGKFPRLIDEWQEVPPLWDAVRFAVDQTPSKGQFILTGSATPRHKGILHSGTGRIGKLKMRTMSLYESADSTGQVSLSRLFDESLLPLKTGAVELTRLVELTLRGGWPASLGLPAELALELPRSYLKAVVEDDMYRVDEIKRDYNKAKFLLHSLARNESTIVSNRSLKRDMQQTDGASIDENTLTEYLNIFQRLFLLEDQLPFHPNVRSSVRVGKSAKRHFIDPSLAGAALGATPQSLLQDLKTFGFLFEALCERDLRIYAEMEDGNLFHYQDHSGREIDAVVEQKDGRWGAFEIKLGVNQIDEAAKKLLAIKRVMEEDPQATPPSILCVLCGMTNLAYQREDGVLVVPITALKN